MCRLPVVRDHLYGYVKEAVPLLTPLLEFCDTVQQCEPREAEIEEACGRAIRRLPPVGLVIPEGPPSAWRDESYNLLVDIAEAALEREILRGFRSSFGFRGVEAWAHTLAGDMIPAIFNDALRVNCLIKFVRRAAPESMR